MGHKKSYCLGKNEENNQLTEEKRQAEKSYVFHLQRCVDVFHPYQESFLLLRPCAPPLR
jgi:hypothetical protein